MRIRLALSVAAVLLLGFAAAAGEDRSPSPEAASVDGALAEPTDPDDAADIRADQNPNDVGQQGLDGAADEAPEAEQPAVPVRIPEEPGPDPD